jgi:MYXO-CTERM domain-containing protein
MRKHLVLGSSLLATLALALVAQGATLIVSPTGTDTADCTRAAPCSLNYTAANAVAGDTVILLDGTYKTKITVANSGTASAWITFQADDCATPIIEGTGIETETGDKTLDQPVGVGSPTATYLRFIGLVSRGWNSGFSNGWVGSGATNSNGHFEFKYCIADGNGRTGFTFFSAEGVHVQNCIAAHNGSSVDHSWSSGMTLYEAQGSSNLIEGSVSFENMDAQQHTDGSGFIADESSDNATFLNNLAFRNGGSCLRLTSSSGVKFINNTCVHNAQDPQDTGPTNPGEIYFTNDVTKNGVTVKNNVFVSTGTGPGAQAVLGQPSSGWSNNVAQDGGSISFFTAPEGTNADYTLATSATSLLGKGSAGGGAPTSDIGFDPKCIVKRTPTMLGTTAMGSWWQYSVDIEYIKSIGGVAKCFNPKTRSGTPDIGAYASGAVTKATTPCVATYGGASSTGRTNIGGAANAGGAGELGGSSAVGGRSAVGGTTGTGASPSATGGNVASNGGNVNFATGGIGASTSVTTGGTATTTVGGATGHPTTGGSATTNPNVGGNSAVGGASSTLGEQPSSGCGCRVSGQPSRSTSLLAFGLLGASLLRLRRRRSA